MLIDLMTFPVWGLFEIESDEIVSINGEPVVTDDHTFIETLYALLETQERHQGRYLIKFGQRYPDGNAGLTPPDWDGSLDPYAEQEE